MGAHQHLPRRALGRTRVHVSEIGLGSACLGNLYEPMSDGDAFDTVFAAFDAGISYIDTAPYYGFGLSEARVGEALSQRQGEIVVSTKVGRVLVPAPHVKDDSERFGFRSAQPFTPMFDYSYDGVMQSWQASRQRLKRSRIEILYVHDIGRLTHGERHQAYFQQLTGGGGLRALSELRAGGEIDAFGIGVNEIAVCLELLQEADLDVILLAGRYTLLEQQPLDDLFPLCLRRGTSIVIGGPYNSGILATGTQGPVAPRFNYEIAGSHVLDRVRRLEQVCSEFAVPLPAAALQFPLAHPVVSSVIPGLGSRSQVAQTVSFHRTPIPAPFWRELKSQQLIREDAPVPADAETKR